MKTLETRVYASLMFLMLGCNQNILAADSENAILSSPAFTRPIVLTVGPDDASSAAFLAARGASIPWWDAIAGTKRSCRRLGGYNPGDTEGGFPSYSVSGYTLTPDQWFNWLTKHNYIRVQNFAVLLTNTPWGKTIPRTYQCFINLDGTDLQKRVGNVHAGGSFAVGQRQVVKWTYRNSYETPMAGKGNVKVFAGKFDYKINSLFPGISFEGPGSGSGKAYLDPDNGRWVAADFNMNDPRMTLLSQGPHISIPPMLSPPPAPPPPRRPVFFKEGKNDNDRQQDESVCGMAEINGQLKGKTWIDCMVQKGWQVRSPTAEQLPVRASAQQPRPPETFACVRTDDPRVTTTLVVDIASSSVKSLNNFAGLGVGVRAQITDAAISWRNRVIKNYGGGGFLNFAGSIDRATRKFTFTGDTGSIFIFECR